MWHHRYTITLCWGYITDCHLGKIGEILLVDWYLRASWWIFRWTVLVRNVQIVKWAWQLLFTLQCSTRLWYALSHQNLIMMIFNRMAYASLWKIKFQTTRVSCELSGNLQQTATISRKETALKSKQHRTGAYKSRQYEIYVQNTCKLSSMRFSSLREIKSVYHYHEAKDVNWWKGRENLG